MTLIRSNYRHTVHFAAFLILLMLSVTGIMAAQDPDQSERDRALSMLWEKSRAEDALPLLEKLAKANPNDGEVRFSLGFALLGHSKLLKTAEDRRATRIRSREELIKARELGIKHPLLTSMLESLPPDGGEDTVFSKNQQADELMRDGEMAYVRGDFAAASIAYQRALQADSKLYEAALFAGDMEFKQNQIEKALEWYARAVQINPDRETAYRYSATPFIEQGKLEEAKGRYLNAVIAEPYNRLTWSGLDRWAKAAGVELGHPRIETPTNVTPLKDNKLTITLDPKMLGDDEKNGTGVGAWIMYGMIRAKWAMSEFAKSYPNESTYRHSLREEAAALAGVVAGVKQRQKDNKIKQLDPTLATLVELSDKGLLEPYILFARADAGIARDYAEYRKANREKLKRYLLEYVCR